MNIVFYCEAGSQSFIFDPRDVTGRGLGGAELSLVGLTTELAKQGHDVTVYNQPPEEGVYDGVRYQSTDTFDFGQHYDVFVLYRNPFEFFEKWFWVKANLILFFSCDQQTSGHYQHDIFPFVHHVITISEYHKQYFVERYGIDPNKVTAIDLPVRVWEYEKPVSKIPNSLLYCSIPDRGLEHLAYLFPAIKQHIPDVTLNITSSYELWGVGIPAGNERYRAMFEGMDGVAFHSKVSRSRLVELQLQSDILAYPNQPVGDFAELFCVSVAESQVAGTIPITSGFGGLQTTAIADISLIKNLRGDFIHPSDPHYAMHFVSMATFLLENRKDLNHLQQVLREKALARFNPTNIAQQWLNLVNNRSHL